MVLHWLFIHKAILLLLSRYLCLHFIKSLASESLLVGLWTLTLDAFLGLIWYAACLFPLGSQVLKHWRTTINLCCILLASLTTWKNGKRLRTKAKRRFFNIEGTPGFVWSLLSFIWPGTWIWRHWWNSECFVLPWLIDFQWRFKLLNLVSLNNIIKFLSTLFNINVLLISTLCHFQIIIILHHLWLILLQHHELLLLLQKSLQLILIKLV